MGLVGGVGAYMGHGGNLGLYLLCFCLCFLLLLGFCSCFSMANWSHRACVLAWSFVWLFSSLIFFTSTTLCYCGRVFFGLFFSFVSVFFLHVLLSYISLVISDLGTACSIVLLGFGLWGFIRVVIVHLFLCSGS